MAGLGTALLVSAYIGYLIALIFPLGLALLFTGIVYSAFIVISHLDKTFALFFLGFVSTGFACAAVIRGISRYLYERKAPFIAIIAVQLIGIMLVPAIFKGPSLYAQFKDGALFSDASNDNIFFLIDGVKVNTPSFNIVNANCSIGQNVYELVRLYIDEKNRKRKFCGKFYSGDKPISVESLEFRFGQLYEITTHPSYLALCNAAEWPKELCEFKGRNIPENYPYKLTIIDKSELQERLRNMIWIPDDYAFSSSANKFESAAVKDFHFNREAFDWIHEVYEDGKTNFILLTCRKKAKLDCAALEKNEHGVYIHYNFETSLDSLMDDAKMVHDKVKSFIAVISKKS